MGHGTRRSKYRAASEAFEKNPVSFFGLMVNLQGVSGIQVLGERRTSSTMTFFDERTQS
jgi:hypothetical protein